jgi:CubicO group peptidase (beta-lactamase class C family)
MTAGRTSRTARTLACAAILALQTGMAAAAAPSAATDRHALGTAHEVVQHLIKDAAIPGLAITVAVDSKVLWSAGYGTADLEHRVPTTPQTRMRIGSISKSMTAAAVASAVQLGVIDLDKSVRDYLPEIPAQYATITLRELGGHLSGIRSYRSASEQMVHRHYDTVKEALAIFLDDPLQNPPGTKFLYTSYGFVLLSAAAERAAHVTFDEFMSTYLWTPLKMQHTGFDDLTKIIQDRARQYQRNSKGELINAAFSDDSYKKAGSGMLSTAPDLAAFGTALLNNGALKSPIRSVLFTSQATITGVRTGYGFGWFVDMDKFLNDHRSEIPTEQYLRLAAISHGRQLIWHSGTASGATAMLLLSPEAHVVVAMICNLGGVEPQVIAASMEVEAALSHAAVRDAP